ncbi:hypothetical protein [Erwinia mallotivora]|uniref:hypothetical protein n=1 Tax=Erwinia mallotivora TaxID=69222 RepID=UPI0021C1A8E1|nr:hypothetical protein [Erwinia mallotivora]
MLPTVVAGALLAGIAFSACGSSATPPAINTEYQITCPGRPGMTITNAQFGLTTMMWAGDNFQIAEGNQQSQTSDGMKVAITLFRNGDQMMVNESNQQTWFSYSGGQKLVRCNRSAGHENSTVTLPHTDASGRVTS